MSNAGCVWYVKFTAAEHGRCGSSFMCKTGVNKAEYLVHSMCTIRLSACREFCGVHFVVVGKMAQDVGMV